MFALFDSARLMAMAMAVLLAVFLWPALIAVAPAMAQAAAGSDGGVKAEETDSSGEGYLFPHKARITHARGFTIEYRGPYKKLAVLTPWRNARETFSYLLFPRGRKPPADVPQGTVVVETPVRRLVLSSTACAALLPMLQIEDTLVGFSGTHLVNTPRIQELIRQGRVEEVGAGGDGMARQLNMERLFALQPDLVVVHGTGIPEFDHHPKLIEAGFKTAVYSNHMESTPLGRIEWIKFLAAFFNKEAEAAWIFHEIVEKYDAMAEKARSVTRRPTVFCGMTLQSTWTTPGGESHMAHFIKDAGGSYVWSDDRTTGSMPVAMEALLERAREADIWLDPGLCESLDELAALDDRYALFRAFRSGNVYNNNARTGPGGGNDYWEEGMARPDLVLADLISIFHPELVTGHERIWYRKLPRTEEGKP